MATAQITVPLTAAERRALRYIADRECREPAEQLRYLLRQEAQRRKREIEDQTALTRKAARRDTGMSPENDQTLDLQHV